MSVVNASPLVLSDATIVKLAREIAIEIFPLESILSHLNISQDQWLKIKEHPRFQNLLSSALQEWNSALNTQERVKIKSAAMVEDWLEEAHARLHDPKEALPAKVELGKLITRLAGMGLTNANVDGATPEKFHITINLGSAKQLEFSKEIHTIPPVYEAEAIPVTNDGNNG